LAQEQLDCLALLFVQFSVRLVPLGKRTNS